jgi:acyl transferase domain-containing protein
MCSAVQIALIDLFRSWGIKPASVTGHSSGEIAAAYTMGALNMEDAMAVAYYRGVASHRMQQEGKVKGSMMAVGMSKEDAEPYISALTSGKAAVACVNSPSSITVSGDLVAINELEAVMEEKKVFARKLAVEVAYHSHHMDYVSEEYMAAIANIKLPAKMPEEAEDGEDAVEFYSSVTGTKASAENLGPEYWVENMLGQVKFADSVRILCLETSAPGSSRGKGARNKRTARKKQAARVNVDMLVEIGPHSALAGPIKQILRADPVLSRASIAYTSALVRRTSAVKTALGLASTLIPNDRGPWRYWAGNGTLDD